MNDKNDKCIGIGRIFGHKFEARYDEKEQGGGCSKEVIAELNKHIALITCLEPFSNCISAANNTNSETKYRGDVCVRCGKVVNAENKNEKIT